MDIRFLSFSQLRSKIIESNNKVGFLVDCFGVLHSEAPPEDFERCGDRIASMIKQAGGDYIRVLQLMWMASANGIQGSHLNYIQKALSRDQAKHRGEDPDRYIKGRYGHMVKR